MSSLHEKNEAIRPQNKATVPVLVMLFESTVSIDVVTLETEL